METLIKSENRNPKSETNSNDAKSKSQNNGAGGRIPVLPAARGSPSRSASDELRLSAETEAGRSLRVLRLGEPRAGGVATLRPVSPIAILKFPIYFGFSTLRSIL